MIFDEVITGFRFHAGTLGTLYGVEPDLTVLGKIVGGGMPMAAFAGRADIMDQLGREQGCRVNVSGGTYSAHPASMLAAKTQLAHLVGDEHEIYPRLADLGAAMRRAVESGFAEGGVLARCTGDSDDLPTGSSLFMVHFPHDEASVLDTPKPFLILRCVIRSCARRCSVWRCCSRTSIWCWRTAPPRPSTPRVI